MYQIIILPAAMKDLKRLNRQTAQRIVDKLSWLSENIENITIQPLKGSLSGFLKLRVGEWRVIYDVDPDQKIITVHRIGHRKEVYKGTI